MAPQTYNSPTAAMESRYSEDGVDLTLIRWMLSLTPAERLQTLEGFLYSVSEIRASDTAK